MSFQPLERWSRRISARVILLSDRLPVACIMIALIILMDHPWSILKAHRGPGCTPTSAKVANFGNRTKYGGGSGVGRRWVDFNN